MIRTRGGRNGSENIEVSGKLFITFTILFEFSIIQTDIISKYIFKLNI